MALAQHSLFGDYVAGGAMILWPINSNWYGLGVCMKSSVEISLELTGFLISLAFMIKTRDIWTFFKPRRTNLILSVPAVAISGSLLLKIGYSVPVELVLPHLTYLTIFILSILTDFRTILKAT